MPDPALALRAGRALRAAALAGKDRADTGPFLVGLHPVSDRIWSNVAAPADGVTGADVDAAAAEALRAAFTARGRTPRLEFCPQLAPGLVDALVAHGFEVQQRVPLLACRADDLRDVAAPAGVTLEAVPAGADPELVRTTLQTATQAFGEPAGSVTDDDVARVGNVTIDGSLVLARADGAPAGAGQALLPQEGVCEVVGIGVLEPFRGRGIGAALTAVITRAAFAGGTELATLTPGDEGAHRIYARCGYVPLTEIVFLRSAAA